MNASTTPEKHPEANQILAVLEKEKIESLYHFTAVENLSGISKHKALCSKYFLEARSEWPCPIPGGNKLSHSLDKTNDNWNKVALNLTAHTPMAYHKKNEVHMCFFVISTEVAGWRGVVFTNSNAASNGHQRGEGLTGLAVINFGMMRCIMPWSQDWINLVQAEVLVPNCVPMSYIKQVAFVSEASKRVGERFWGNSNHPAFVVDKEIFHNSSNSSEKLLGFPFVSHVILTDSTVSSGNVRNITSHTSCFKRQNTSTITAIVGLQALAGTRAKVKWCSETEEEEEFQKSETWLWWTSIPINKLSNGQCSLEISLNDVLWAVADFEVIP